MESSNHSLDNTVRFRRKVQNLTIISALMACCLTFILVFTNIHLIDLNKAELNKLSQHQDQIQVNLQAKADIQKALDESKAEIDQLKKKLTAEKSKSETLKGKLANALRLIAQPRETTVQMTESPNTETSRSSSTPNLNHPVGTPQQNSAQVQQKNIHHGEAETPNEEAQMDAGTTQPAQINDAGDADNTLTPNPTAKEPSLKPMDKTQEPQTEPVEIPSKSDENSSLQPEKTKNTTSNNEVIPPVQPSDSDLDNEDQNSTVSAITRKSNGAQP